MPPRLRPPESPARRVLRVMLMRVFGLHLVAITVHELADVATRPRAQRMAFLGLWLALTCAIVGIGLWRMRLARRVGRRPNVPPPNP